MMRVYIMEVGVLIRFYLLASVIVSKPFLTFAAGCWLVVWQRHLAQDLGPELQTGTLAPGHYHAMVNFRLLCLLFNQHCPQIPLPWTSNYLLDLGFNFTFRIDHGPVFQFLHSSTCFSGVLRFEDDFQFFKRDAFRLHVEEIDEDKLENVPEDEEDIKPIANL